MPGNKQQQNYLSRLLLDRMEQLISLDRMVGEVVTAAGSNTIIIFTSDNGHFNGEHRLGNKLSAQEESVRVPLYVRGPAACAAQGDATGRQHRHRAHDPRLRGTFLV